MQWIEKKRELTAEARPQTQNIELDSLSSSRYSGFRDLMAVTPAKRECAKNGPEQFWDDHQREIAQGLKERYTLTDHPDIEVITPVHHNAADLPLLLWSLARQDLPTNKNIRFTVVMHNNTNRPELDQSRDESWDMVDALVAAEVPVHIVPLDDPILAGPYISWQYGLLQAEGKISAVIDADSVLPASWVRRIVAPLEHDHSVLITSGVRILFGTERKIEILSHAYYLSTAISSVLAPPGPNLAIARRFIGGQAAYRTSAVQPLLRKWCGLPQGDHALANQVLQKFGESSYQFSDAPVHNRVDPHRNSKHFWHKFGMAARTITPKSLDRFLPELPDDQYTSIASLLRYCPWSRPLITQFMQHHVLSGQQIKSILENTAQDQFFANYYSAIRFFDQQHFNDCVSFEKLCEYIYLFAREVVRPEMLKRLGDET